MSSTFVPPDYYSLPPFFTIQPIEETRQKQMQMWLDYILAYCRHHHQTSVNIHRDQPTALFTNAKIQRALSLSDVRVVLEFVCSQGFGKWIENDRCVVTWKRFDDWGGIIYRWAIDSGNNLCTIYELGAGDDSVGTEFHGLHSDVLLIAVQTLEKQMKAALIPGSTTDETGVKFIEK